jgi:PIN like domain
LKVLIDENLPPALARALAALFVGEHEIDHLRIKYGAGVKDVDWIGALNQEGRWIVVSGDTRITRNKAEQMAFRNSRLIGFFLAPSLKKAKLTRQMQRILALWEDIDALSQRVAGGAMFELPMSGAIRQLKV